MSIDNSLSLSYFKTRSVSYYVTKIWNTSELARQLYITAGFDTHSHETSLMSKTPLDFLIIVLIKLITTDFMYALPHLPR